MGKYRIRPKADLTSVTTQEYKTLHETLDEYLRTGVLDTPASDSSFDFKDADDVDFNRPVPHDVDIYDAACGHDDPYLGVTPLNTNNSDSSDASITASGADESATTMTEA